MSQESEHKWHNEDAAFKDFPTDLKAELQIDPVAIESPVDLGPDDVIRSGDQYKSETGNTWFNFVHSIGRKISDRHWAEWGDEQVVFRRPRSTLIRDAAIELIATIDAEMQSDFPQLSDEILAAASDLRRVMGERQCDK